MSAATSKVFIVTGANAGIGKEIARSIGKQGNLGWDFNWFIRFDTGHKVIKRSSQGTTSNRWYW